MLWLVIVPQLISSLCQWGGQTSDLSLSVSSEETLAKQEVGALRWMALLS